MNLSLETLAKMLAAAIEADFESPFITVSIGASKFLIFLLPSIRIFALFAFNC